MKIPHLKSYQCQQYKRADQRIKQAIGRAKLNWEGHSYTEHRETYGTHIYTRLKLV